MNINSKLQLLLDAQSELNKEVAAKRVELLRSLKQQEEMRAPDKIEVSITAALEAFEGTLPLAFLGQAFSDSAELLSARKRLKDAKVIEEIRDEQDKTKILVRLLPAAREPAA